MTALGMEFATTALASVTQALQELYATFKSVQTPAQATEEQYADVAFVISDTQERTAALGFVPMTVVPTVNARRELAFAIPVGKELTAR